MVTGNGMLRERCASMYESGSARASDTKLTTCTMFDDHGTNDPTKDL